MHGNLHSLSLLFHPWQNNLNSHFDTTVPWTAFFRLCNVERFGPNSGLFCFHPKFLRHFFLTSRGMLCISQSQLAHGGAQSQYKSWPKITIFHYQTPCFSPLLFPPAYMSGKRPPDMFPWEWQEYLRRFPRMAWWLRQVNGNHPDYPGMFQNHPSSQHPLLPQRNYFASSTPSSHPSLLPTSQFPFDLRTHQRRIPRASTSSLTPLSRSRSALSPSQSLSGVHPTTSQALASPLQCAYTIPIYFLGTFSY
jgi:hypothetical protein